MHDLFITNSIGSFHQTTAVTGGLSDSHKMMVAVSKTSFQKAKPKETLYRNCKMFNINTFKNVLRLKLQSIKSNECFEQVFLEVLIEHAPLTILTDRL